MRFRIWNTPSGNSRKRIFNRPKTGATVRSIDWGSDMTHLWVRAEQRENEERVGLTPAGVAALINAGIQVTVEHSSVRAIAIDGYGAAGPSWRPKTAGPRRRATPSSLA